MPSKLDPSLLDVVPWSYGFAHSWALAALLGDTRIASAILDGLPDELGPTPRAIAGAVEREQRFGRVRADLMFAVRDSFGASYTVAVETKVDDPFRPGQLSAYTEAGCVPLLLLPGLTGLLVEVMQDARVKNCPKLRPARLLAAVDTVEASFAPLLDGYLNALREENARMERAVAHARGEIAPPIGDGHRGQCAGWIVEDVAWLAETYRALPSACAGTGIKPDAKMRIEAHDRGFFFGGSFFVGGHHRRAQAPARREDQGR